MAVKRTEAAPLLSLLVALPLVYLSGAWIPVESMTGGLRTFARNQPVNTLVTAVRALSDGTPAAHDVALAIAWSLGILAVSMAACIRRYAAGSS
jgi:ABC-type multidrug transport system permease subunit